MKSYKILECYLLHKKKDINFKNNNSKKWPVLLVKLLNLIIVIIDCDIDVSNDVNVSIHISTVIHNKYRVKIFLPHGMSDLK